jgi:hypothetical protein
VQLRGLYETRVALLMNLRSASMLPDPIALHSLSLLYKFVRTFGKFFRRVQHVEVARFVDLPLCDDLVLYYWEKVVQANSSAELIEGMLVGLRIGDCLISHMVRLGNCCVPRSHSRDRDGFVQGKSRPMVPDTENKDRTYFERVPEPFTSLFCSHYCIPALSQDFVETAVTFLVTRFMPLIPNDLEGWMASPEEWVNTEDKDDEQWQFELRVSLKMPPICMILRVSVAMCRACSHDPCEPVSRVRHPTTCEGIR